MTYSSPPLSGWLFPRDDDPIIESDEDWSTNNGYDPEECDAEGYLKTNQPN